MTYLGYSHTNDQIGVSPAYFHANSEGKTESDGNTGSVVRQRKDRSATVIVEDRTNNVQHIQGTSDLL